MVNEGIPPVILKRAKRVEGSHLLILLLLFLPLLATGQRLLEADTVVVEGRHKQAEQVLKGDELRALSAQSVADAVRYFSGVQIKDYGGIGGLKTIDVRSLGANHVGVFYDGVMLDNGQNGQVDLGRFSMDNMASIELVNGLRGGLLLSARDFAAGSTVRLETRRPVKNTLKFSVETGSFGTINPSVLAEKQLSEKTWASLSAEYLSTTGRYRFTYKTAGGYDTTAVRQNGDVRALRIEGGLFGRLRSGGDWRGKIYFYDSGRGFPGASVREEPGVFRNEDRQWDRNVFAQGSMRQSWGDWSMSATAKLARDELHFVSDPRKDVSTMPVDERFIQHEIYASAALGRVLSEHLQAGFSSDFQHNSLGRHRRGQGLFAASGAWRRGDFTAQAAMVYNQRLLPSISVSYSLAEGFTVHGFYKKVLRLPTMGDLYYTSVGRRDLKPEVASQFDIGAIYTHKWLSLKIDGYVNRVTDKIVAMPAQSQFQWTMVNFGRVDIRGIDASVEASKGPATVRLSYTWQSARDKTSRTDPWYGGQIPYIPWNSGSLVVGLRHRDWGLNYSFLYTGERYTSRANIPENHLQPWYTSDLSLSRSLGNFRLTAELNNLFDQQYEVVTCYPMPGLNFKIVMSYEL